MAVFVKICGLTHPDDALAAVAAGADALGFMFYPESPRFLAPHQVAEIVRLLPLHVTPVGVFVNPTRDAVRQAIEECGITVLQFHGEETTEFLASLALDHFSAPPVRTGMFAKTPNSGTNGVRTIKAFRIRDAATLGALSRYHTDLWLLDSFVPNRLGGTGAQFNWDLAVQAAKLGRPIILAGGLTPDNVANAVRHVHPYAVDVASGIEIQPGRKDAAKVRDFVQAAKQADAGIRSE